MITICKKCKHHITHWILERSDECGASVTKETNFVTGKVTSHYRYCYMINTSGNCSSFVEDKKNG